MTDSNMSLKIIIIDVCTIFEEVVCYSFKQLRVLRRATKCVENNLLYMPYITMLGKAVHYFQILS